VRFSLKQCGQKEFGSPNIPLLTRLKYGERSLQNKLQFEPGIFLAAFLEYGDFSVIVRTNQEMKTGYVCLKTYV